MIYISEQFNLKDYNYYSLYGDKILFLSLNSNYISTDFNTTKYHYAIYYLNSQQFVEFDSQYLPYEFISLSHLNNLRLYPVYDGFGNISYWNTQGSPNPTYSTIYLSDDFTQFTNDFYYSPFFSLIFIVGFLILLIITFIINGLTRFFSRGGLFFTK